VPMILLLILLTQGAYSYCDLMAAIQMKAGFSLSTFTKPWFFIYTGIRLVATFGQLYVIALVPLGWMSGAFGAVSIVASNVLGVLVMRQVLSPVGYAGVMLSTTAFLVMAVGASGLIGRQRPPVSSQAAASAPAVPQPAKSAQE
jgi:hypothetical protein